MVEIFILGLLRRTQSPDGPDGHVHNPCVGTATPARDNTGRDIVILERQYRDTGKGRSSLEEIEYPIMIVF